MSGYDVGHSVDGRYKVLRTLGQGGMGVVYEVVDVTDGTLYALKTCLESEEEARRRFARETRFMSQLNHENVMPVIASNVEADPPYFVMPLADRSLSAEIGAGMEEDVALECILQVCKGVQAIHTAHGTHRDIKPENILRLQNNGPLVVSDLGLVKMDPRDTTVLTRTAAVVGTRIYCAPEQLLPGGSRDADARTDVYQIGKTLYQMLTGALPALIDPGRLPRSLAALIQRATREHPNERYQSVDQLVDAINSYILSKSPGASASNKFDALLAEANELLLAGQFSKENLDALIGALLAFVDNEEIFLNQFDRILPEILQSMAANCDRMTEVLDHYQAAVKSNIRERNFEYAEQVGKQMRAVFFSAEQEAVKAKSLIAVLVAAVRLNRWAAMSIFDEMLISIKRQEDAVSVAEVLRDHIDLYEVVAERVSSQQLHPVLQPVRALAIQER